MNRAPSPCSGLVHWALPVGAEEGTPLALAWVAGDGIAASSPARSRRPSGSI